MRCMYVLTVVAKGKGYSDVLCKELVELVLPVFQVSEL